MSKRTGRMVIRWNVSFLSARYHIAGERLEVYHDFLNHLKAQKSVVFVPMKDFGQTFYSDKIVLGIRHDIDIDLLTAVKLSKIEYNLGVRGTYYLLISNPYYYGVPGRKSFVRLADSIYFYKCIQDNGGEIGLHNDFMNLWVKWDIQPKDLLASELEWLRRNGLKIMGTSSHGSVYNCGASNYEIFEGMTIEGRSHVKIGKTTYPLGLINPIKYGLDYEANYMRYSYFTSLDFPKNQSWVTDSPVINEFDYMDVIVHNYDHMISIYGKDYWTIGIDKNRKNHHLNVSDGGIEKIYEFFSKVEGGTKIVLNVHPIYFNPNRLPLSVLSLASRIKNYVPIR